MKKKKNQFIPNSPVSTSSSFFKFSACNSVNTKRGLGRKAVFLHNMNIQTVQLPKVPWSQSWVQLLNYDLYYLRQANTFTKVINMRIAFIPWVVLNKVCTKEI